MRAAVRQLSCATPERSAEMFHYLDFGARLSARSRMPRFPDQDWRGSHMSAFQPFIACDRHLARNRSSQADFHGKSSLLSRYYSELFGSRPWLGSGTADSL